MPAVVFFIGRVGRIEHGPDADRFLRVDAADDGEAYVARIANDLAFTDVVGDQWLEAIEELPEFFLTFGSTIDWLD